jgi:steroid 5-alpha reductase family enzyme
MKQGPVAAILGLTLLSFPLMYIFFGTPLGDLELSALRPLLWVLGASILLTFTLGEITGNNSQVDKIWSILPLVYTWIVAYYGDFSTRLVVMATLVTIWGLRLSINFGLKGAYQWKFWGGEEDYRWKYLRTQPEFQAKWKWSLFNFGFICGYQNLLIFLFTMPILIALQFNNQPFGKLDLIFAILMFLFILYETIADIQQFRFQTAKHALLKLGLPLDEKYSKGFLDRGLWKYSRHPNYFAEQSIWFMFYSFSIAASGQWLNWSIAGSILLIALFLGSSNFSEHISASKYPEYKNYQKKVSRFIPFLK